MTCWDVIGIAETIDEQAIKRAYAQRLRITRPDDDADAYQRLRDAYDQAREWARAASEADVSPVDACEPIAIEPATTGPAADELPSRPTASNPSAHAPSPVILDPDMTSPDTRIAARPELLIEVPHAPPPWIAPAVLVDTWHAYWQQHGDAALLDAWPRLHHDLDMLPLSLRTEASARFADFVLRHPHVPAKLIAWLSGYFDWSRDFRSDQQLGRARAHALEQRIASAYATLSTRTGPLTARSTGVVIGRFTLCMVLTGLIAAMATDDPSWLFDGMKLCAAAIFMALLLQRVGAALFDRGGDWLQRTLPAALTSGRRHRHLVLSIVAAAMAYGIARLVADDPLRAAQLSVPCMMAVLLLAWPRAEDWRGVVPLLLSVTCVALDRLVGSAAEAIGLATAWMVLTLWAFEATAAAVRRLYDRPFAFFAPRSAFGSIALLIAFPAVSVFAAIAAVVLAPATMLALAVRHGPMFAITALAVIVTLWRALLPTAPAGPELMLLLIAVPPALHVLEGLTGWLTRRVLRGPDGRSQGPA